MRAKAQEVHNSLRETNFAEIIRSGDRQALRDVIASLNSYVDAGNSARKNVRAIQALANRMERYLYQLDPACMDFLEWHESAANHRPTPRC